MMLNGTMFVVLKRCICWCCFLIVLSYWFSVCSMTVHQNGVTVASGQGDDRFDPSIKVRIIVQHIIDGHN